MTKTMYDYKEFRTNENYFSFISELIRTEAIAIIRIYIFLVLHIHIFENKSTEYD